RRPAGGVGGDVVAVRGVGAVPHAGEVGGVVEGGGELADAAADGLARAAVDDDAGLDVALGGAAGSGVAVEGEGVAGGDDRAVDHGGHLRDVDAGGRGVAGGGEVADDLVEGGHLGHLGGEGGGFVLVDGVPLTVGGVGGQETLLDALQRRLPVELHTVDAGGDLAGAAGEADLRV